MKPRAGNNSSSGPEFGKGRDSTYIGESKNVTGGAEGGFNAFSDKPYG